MSNFKVEDGILIEDFNYAFFQPGDIVMTVSLSAEDGWILCNGQIFSAIEYPALATAIGTYYGGGTQYRVPNLNGSGLAYPVYVTPVIGAPSSFTANVGGNHTHNFTSADYSTGSFTTAAHLHNYNYNGNNETDDHRHDEVGNASDGGLGTAWSISADVANYSTSGTAGGTAFRNHGHNMGSRNVYTNNVAVAHSHTHSGNSNNPGITHSHPTSVSQAFQEQLNTYPESISVRFMIKV